MASTRLQKRTADRPGPYKLDAVTREIPIEFELRDKVWSVSADPDVEVVATMLRIEERLEGIDDVDNLTDDDGRDLADYIVMGKELILDLIKDWGEQQQPLDRDAFRISVTELLSLFGLITGSESAAVAIAETLTAGVTGGRSAEEIAAGLDGEGGEDAAPLPSARRSSRRSPSSAARTGGRRRTGGA